MIIHYNTMLLAISIFNYIKSGAQSIWRLVFNFQVILTCMYLYHGIHYTVL